jgi:hypothetical protein
MENFRFNNLQLQTESQTEATAGSKIVLNLPSQGAINLSSLTMQGKVVAVSEGIQLAHAGIGSLIQRVDVAIGGAIVDSVQNYNQLYSMVKKWTCSTDRQRQAGMSISQGAPAAAQANGQVGTDLAASVAAGDYNGTYTAAVAAGALATEIQTGLIKTQNWVRNVCLNAATESASFNYSSWLGLLGKDMFLQLDTLPSPVQITITLDDNSCVASHAGGGTFKLTDLAFRVQSVEFPLLSRSIYAMLSRNQPVPIPFTRWLNFSFSNAAGAVITNRYSVATQCLSRIWVQNNKTTHMAHATRNAAARDTGAEVPKFLSCADGLTSYYAEIDNRRQAQYDVELAKNAYAWNLEQLGVNSDLDYDNEIQAMNIPGVAASVTGDAVEYGSANFYGSCWLALFNFAFNHYDADSHDAISGINTMGLSSACSVNARTGATSASTTSYFVETRATLNVLPNRQIEVVY